MTEPRAKVKVNLKLKSAVEARKEIMMLRLVAKPFKMLSEYLMTMAVTRPPRTCTETVAHAHAPKLWKGEDIHPSDNLGLEACEKMTGAKAGRIENADN